MDKIKENPLTLILNVIAFLTRKANSGEFKGGNAPAAPERFGLEGLVSCFLGINQDNFLTDVPLQNYFENFSKGDKAEDADSQVLLSGIPDAQLLKPVREAIPEGAQLTFAVLPCRINGLPLAPKHFDDSKDSDHQYFHVFYSDPANKRGLAKTADCEEFAPYLKVLPKEFLDQCSFIVRYPEPTSTLLNEHDPDREARDFQYFEAECHIIYQNLQNLVKGKI